MTPEEIRDRARRHRSEREFVPVPEWFPDALLAADDLEANGAGIYVGKMNSHSRSTYEQLIAARKRDDQTLDQTNLYAIIAVRVAYTAAGERVWTDDDADELGTSADYDIIERIAEIGVRLNKLSKEAQAAQKKTSLTIPPESSSLDSPPT